MENEVASGWIAITMFVAIGSALSFASYFRFRSEQELQRTVRAALESGRDLTPETVAQLAATVHPPDRDLRRGLISIVVGLALVTLAFMVGEPAAFGPLIGVSSFPFLIGLAYLLMWFVQRRRESGS